MLKTKSSRRIPLRPAGTRLFDNLIDVCKVGIAFNRITGHHCVVGAIAAKALMRVDTRI